MRKLHVCAYVRIRCVCNGCLFLSSTVEDIAIQILLRSAATAEGFHELAGKIPTCISLG